MTTAIGSVSASNAVDGLNPVGAAAQQQQPDNQAFLDVLDQGLSTLATRPDPKPEGVRALDGLSSEYGGAVGEAKVDMVAGEAARAEQAGKDNGVTLEQRLQSLYMELTHYQIAWRIAQNVQRDVSQVLRGS